MHSPSEHTVDGKHYDLELHILHHYKGTDGMLGAMIGIFFQVDEEHDEDNDLFTSIFEV